MHRAAETHDHDDDHDDYDDDYESDHDGNDVYWENTRQIWWPGGASVESRLEGIVISIIGLLTRQQ